MGKYPLDGSHWIWCHTIWCHQYDVIQYDVTNMMSTIWCHQHDVNNMMSETWCQQNDVIKCDVSNLMSTNKSLSLFSPARPIELVQSVRMKPNCNYRPPKPAGTAVLRTFWWNSNVMEWIKLHFIAVVAFTSFQTVPFTSNRNLVRGAVIDSIILGFGQDSRFDSWFISRAIRFILIGSAEMIHSPPLYKSSETWFSAQFSQSSSFKMRNRSIPQNVYFFVQ